MRANFVKEKASSEHAPGVVGIMNTDGGSPGSRESLPGAAGPYVLKQSASGRGLGGSNAKSERSGVDPSREEVRGEQTHTAQVAPTAKA